MRSVLIVQDNQSKVVGVILLGKPVDDGFLSRLNHTVSHVDGKITRVDGAEASRHQQRQIGEGVLGDARVVSAMDEMQVIQAITQLADVLTAP